MESPKKPNKSVDGLSSSESGSSHSGPFDAAGNSNNNNTGAGGVNGGKPNHKLFEGARREPLMMVPLIVCALVVLAVNVAYTQKRYSLQQDRADDQGMLPRLTHFILHTTEEMIVSTTFLKNLNASMTDRQLVLPLQQSQDRSLFILQDLQNFYRHQVEKKGPPIVYDETYKTSEMAKTQDPFIVLPFSTLRSMQYQVKQRSVFTSDVIRYYDNLRLDALGLMGVFAQRELPSSTRHLYIAMHAAHMVARNSLDRVAAAQTELLSVGSVSSLTTASRSHFDNVFLKRQLLPLMQTSDDERMYTIAQQALGLNATMETLYNSYRKTGTWNIQVGGATTPSEELTLLKDVLHDISDRVETSQSYTHQSDRKNRITVILACTAIGGIVIVLAAVVVRAIQAVIQEADDAMETSQMHSLEASYRRMAAFLQSIGSMHMAGIKSAEGRNVQTVERDVYALEAPTKHLIAFLHPALPVLRAQEYKRQRDGRLTVTTTNTTNSSSSNSNDDALMNLSHQQQQLGDQAMTDMANINNNNNASTGGNNGTASGAVGNGSGGNNAAGNGMGSMLSVDDDLMPRRLRSVTVTLMCVDLAGWQSRVTSETAKVAPREFARFVQRVTHIVEQHHGIVHDASSSKLIAGWNLCDDCHETESLACQAVLALHKTLSVDHSFLRFSVATGDCSVGVVGTDTLKSFVCVGPIVPLSSLLLRLNRLHGTVCAIDDVTFAKLDGQTFRTRPLEVIAVDAHCAKSVGFELLTSTSPSDKDGRNASWNEAFDEYKSGNIDRAKSLLRRWQASFGETRSITRLLHLISEDPPRQCTYKHNDDGLLEDDLM